MRPTGICSCCGAPLPSDGTLAQVCVALYALQDRPKEAEALIRGTLAIQKRVLGPEHPDTLRSMSNLAWHQSTDEESESRLESMSHLALAYGQQGRFEEAEGLHRETLDIRKRVLGPEHPRTLVSMHGLADSYQAQGRFKEAEALYQEILDMQKRVLGPEHQETLATMNGLAHAYHAQGRYKQAEALFGELLDIAKRVLGPEDPGTLELIFNLACTAALRGERSEALRYLREAVEHGESDAEWMLGDADLASLRGDHEFEKIVAAARANQERAARAK